MAIKQFMIGGVNHKVISLSRDSEFRITIVLEPIDFENSSELERALYDFMNERRKQFPSFGSVVNASFEEAYKEILKLLQKGETPEMIIKCLKAAVNDDFWKRNLMVLTSLNMKCKDGLTKYEQIKRIVLTKNPNADNKQTKDKFSDYADL